MKQLILILCFLFTPFVVNADNPTDGSKTFIFESWTGGLDNCLDSVDGAYLQALPGESVAFVFGTIDAYEVWSVYKFNKTSTATESDIINIAPDNNGTIGRWIQKVPVFCFGTVEPSKSDGVAWFNTKQE